MTDPLRRAPIAGTKPAACEPSGVSGAAIGRTWPAAGLLSRLYARADASLRADMLGCLLRPLGVLSIAGVAAGCFAGLLHHRQLQDGSLSADEVVAYSSQQVLELARFVHQVDPQALRQAADRVMASPAASTDLNASTLARLYAALGEGPP